MMNSNRSMASSATDAVLREVWRAKDSLSAEYDHDLRKLFSEARKRQADSRRRVVNLQRDAVKSSPH